jgi:hypothetical protein
MLKHQNFLSSSFHIKGILMYSQDHILHFFHSVIIKHARTHARTHTHTKECKHLMKYYTISIERHAQTGMMILLNSKHLYLI